MAVPRFSRAQQSQSWCRQSALPTYHHVEDRRPPLVRGGERALQSDLQLGAVFDPLAMEAEMASDLLIIRPFDRHAEMQVFAGRGAVGIVMNVTLAHRLVFFVIENDDDDRQLVPLGGAERLDDRVIEKRAVADEQHHRALRRRKLDAERGAYALPETARTTEETLRRRQREVLADERRMGDRLVHVDRISGHRRSAPPRECGGEPGASLRLLPPRRA